MSRLARDKTRPVPSVNSTRALLQNLYDTHLYFVIQSSSQLYSVYKKRLYSDTIYKIIFYPILLTCQMHTDYTVNSAHDLFIYKCSVVFVICTGNMNQQLDVVIVLIVLYT